MNQAITQSLAGRVGILTLFPLSMHELSSNSIAPASVDEVMFNGFYPRIYDEHFTPTELYPSYMQSYIERDVRQLANVGDLNMFKKLIKLCAGRVGQLLNCSELSNELGISVPTVQRWISILEASYIIFLLQPYANNFNRRVIRHPKIYFYDTGLMCSLLGIESPNRLEIDRLRGSIFENFIIADLYKQYSNIGKLPSLYFWRDKNGDLEVDCIVDDGRKLHPIEIKSSETISLDFFANLKKWHALANAATIPLGRSHVFYGGLETKSLDELGTVGWHDMGTFVQRIRNEK
jgi:predicted AAA+ superfamily ATPase